MKCWLISSLFDVVVCYVDSPPPKIVFVCDWNRLDIAGHGTAKAYKKTSEKKNRRRRCRYSRYVSIARRFLLLIFFFVCFVRDDAHPKVLINLTGSCLTRLLSFCRRSSAHWAYSILHSLSLSLIYCISLLDPEFYFLFLPVPLA
jgi:hypothetical protein